MLVNSRSVIRGHTYREHRTFTRKGEHVVARMSAEEVSKYPRFRLKVDLSRFLHDARQYCWIFVDSSKMLQIRHIEHHISKLFGIPFPFHLMLNNTEYLPPMEDARILENNETILVLRGTGIDASSKYATCSLSDIKVLDGHNDIAAKVEACNGSVQDKKDAHSTNINITETLDTLDVSNNHCDLSAISANNNTMDAMFYSVIDDMEEDTESKTTENNLTEDSCIAENSTSTVAIRTKRKRVRKRKPKNPPKIQEYGVFVSPALTDEQSQPKKPKIIDSHVIPITKHIRFDNTESDDNSMAKKLVQEVSKNEQLSYMNRNLSRDLSLLLELGKSSTPMFVKKKKITSESSADSMNDETRNKCLSKDNEIDTSMEKKSTELSRKGYYKNVELEKIPIMTKQPQLKDIIAFKTLKIGTDYTPQLSEFIVTEVVDFSVQSANYTLRVLEGKEEIQVPLGKFSLSEDEITCPTQTFLLNYKQMKELRLIL